MCNWDADGSVELYGAHSKMLDWKFEHRKVSNIKFKRVKCLTLN